MEQTQITITRRTRKLGWGYCCWTKLGDTPIGPDVTGTVKNCFDYARHDKDYQSMRSGGTYLAEQWYYDGKPIWFSHEDEFLKLDDVFAMLNDKDFGGDYFWDSVDVSYL
jgi:hypothetical protein